MTISDQPRVDSGTIPVDTLAARLVLVRMHRGYLTIKQAAALCGVNYGSWSNWERGIEPARRMEVVDKIADGLHIDRHWLMFGGPLAEAEENRDRWRLPPTITELKESRTEGLDTGRYQATAPQRLIRSLTRPGDTRPTNRPDGTLAVAA